MTLTAALNKDIQFEDTVFSELNMKRSKDCGG